MSDYAPRQTMIGDLEMLMGTRFMAPDAIHEQDLRELWRCMMALLEEVNDYDDLPVDITPP
jgi:hypothetical protein